ncbi:MAG: hypothetical protein M1832_001816 [Thelocarpon impressellum]|nr:MAG: hypothetical protein M1832_001816 [Thelocarpon impressellum]
MASADDDEDDYMNMAIKEPDKPKEKETYTQRRLRKEREAEQKRPKSRVELAAAAAQAREAALSQPLHASAPDSKGLKMMQKMGFKAGDVLGAGGGDARAEPIGVELKDGRGGLGLDSERKRKVREEFEGERKRVKAEEMGFRERVAREREEKRAEGLLVAAQKVAERLEAEGEQGAGDERADGGGSGAPITKPLAAVNVLWRTLPRQRLEADLERRRRHDLQQSLSRLPTYEEDSGSDAASGAEQELELEAEDDEELAAFEALPPAERLEKLVLFLRERWRYCFWCKCAYPDEDLEGCPGVKEDDHD